MTRNPFGLTDEEFARREAARLAAVKLWRAARAGDADAAAKVKQALQGQSNRGSVDD